MAENDHDQKKGFFGRIRFPLSRAYLYPERRNRLLLVGLVVAAAAAALLLADIGFRSNRLISNGPLSSGHAAFENDCATCHTQFESASDDKCLACHEPSGHDPADHAFDAHYVYLSGDATRAFRRDHETACTGCHLEHRGRDASITRVPNQRCTSCHQVDPFEEAHPQFEALAEGGLESPGLLFTHLRHVQNVRREQQIEKIQDTCSSCHKPNRDGSGFLPIEFDRSCGNCHLGVAQRVRSANLPVQAGPLLAARGEAHALNLGVETLDQIRSRDRPDDQWAFEMASADFRARGDDVMKMRLRHQDPWILHNLSRLRRTLYPIRGLSDLLKASARVSPADSQVLYQEALQTLEGYLRVLRGRVEQSDEGRELVALERLLRDTTRRVEDPNTALDDSRFLLDATPDPRLDSEQVEQIRQFAETLTGPCLKCHQLQDLSIERVAKDQRTLIRAGFNHSAHLLQRGCLDCHSRIPFQEFLGSIEASGKSPTADAESDRAEVVNLPGIENCTSCHSTGVVSNSCVTCHQFHPVPLARTGVIPLVPAKPASERKQE